MFHFSESIVSVYHQLISTKCHCCEGLYISITTVCVFVSFDYPCSVVLIAVINYFSIIGRLIPTELFWTQEPRFDIFVFQSSHVGIINKYFILSLMIVIMCNFEPSVDTTQHAGHKSCNSTNKVTCSKNIFPLIE